METAERRVAVKRQQIISVVVNIGTIVGLIITASIIFGNLQEEHAWFRADIDNLRCAIEEEQMVRDRADRVERAERSAEYMKLQLQMTEVELKLEHIATGQEWVISRLKGEI